MNITIVTSPFGCIPPYSLGAVERLWHQVGVYLREHGHNVTFISKKPTENITDSEGYIYIKGYGRSKWTLIDNTLRDALYSWKALSSAPKSDVIVLNTIWSPILILLFWWKFKTSVYNVARFPKFQTGLYGLVSCLSCVSSPVLSALVQMHPHLKSKSTFVNNPINTSVFRCDQTFQKFGDIVKVVYSGRVHREKGLDVLAKALEIVSVESNRQFELSIVGPYEVGKGGSGEEYVNEIKDCAKSFKINWVGSLYSSEELAAALKQNDIFCYPSLADKGETFGVAPLEAMGLGLITVVSALECFSDFLVDGQNGVVFNHRVAEPERELANALKVLISDEQKCRNLSQAAAKTAERFSVDHIAQQYANLFQKLLRDA